jgi:hypothetical protein
MNISIHTLVFLLAAHAPGLAQALVYPTHQMANNGLSIKHLDSLYTPAVHADTSQALWKTPTGQQTFSAAYTAFVQEMGKFMSTNGLKWERPTKCWLGCYFGTDGRLDYVLFNFTGKPDEKPSEDVQNTFKELLVRFSIDHAMVITSTLPFSQCSGVHFMPPQE